LPGSNRADNPEPCTSPLLRASLLFPDLALIAIGWLIYRSGRLPAAFWEGTEGLVYYVLFPALLFGSISRATLSAAQAAPMIATAYSALAMGILLSYSARWLLRPDSRQFASGAQCGFRFNSYITLALASRIGEAPGLALAALITGFIVPIANTAAVYPLARHGGGSVWKALVRNPLVLATLAGLLSQILGLKVPEPVDATRRAWGRRWPWACCAWARPAAARDPDRTGPGAQRARLRCGSRSASWWRCRPPAADGAGLHLAPLATTIVVMFAAMPQHRRPTCWPTAWAATAASWPS
jgi:hypothetical protein